MVVLLEFFGHVVSDLADCVQGSESNFRIRVGAMLAQYWHHHRNLLRFVDVFPYLTDRHDTSIFVAPVRVILNCVYNESAY